jgi:hypothetical protein
LILIFKAISGNQRLEVRGATQEILEIGGAIRGRQLQEGFQHPRDRAPDGKELRDRA